jgi:hypothetical protein
MSTPYCSESLAYFDISFGGFMVSSYPAISSRILLATPSIQLEARAIEPHGDEGKSG